MGRAPGSITHAQAQIDVEHTDLQEDSQIPDDVEALLNEIARERDAIEGGPPDPLGWITPEHQAAMAALAEHALADPQAARLRARRENATARPARRRARPRPVPPPVPLQAAEMDQLLDDVEGDGA